MRKFYLAALITSLFVAQSKLMAATQNFTTTPTTEAAPAPVIAKPAPAAPVATGAAADQAARDEMLRRQDAQLRARQMIDEGQKLYYDGRYDAAIAKLEAALKILPRAQATTVDANRAKHALTESYYQLADAAYRAGDNAKAKDLAKKALDYDRDNLPAENILVKVKSAESDAAAQARRAKAEGAVVKEEVTPDKTPEFLDKKAQIKKLFREGKLLMNSGQYNEAEKRFKAVLLLDHYNDDAYKLLSELNDQRLDSANIAYDTTHSRRVWEVADAWVPPVGSEVKLPQPSDARPITASLEQQAKVVEKLNKIIFPEISFREAVISDVVNFLSSESRRLDPDKTGVNIVLGAGLSGGAAAPSAEGAPAAAPTGVRPVTLSLQKVPMIEALKYVTQLAGLKYRVEANAVLIVPEGFVEGQMITRSYPVSPGAFKTLVANPSASTSGFAGGVGTTGGTSGGAGGAVISSAGGDVKQLFQDAGVNFPPGSSLVYNDRTSTVIIRNTPENLDTFERVLATFNVVPSQVEIEAKFIDVNQADLDELGFNVSVGGAWPNGSRVMLKPGGQTTTSGGTNSLVTGGLRDFNSLGAAAIENWLVKAPGQQNLPPTYNQVGWASIIASPQVDFFMNALSQKKSTDVLSAPKVTTISGAQAQLRVVQEFIYPTEYSVPTVGNGIPTPSIPSSFKTREVGVILNVTPTVGPDGYTINLTLVPEVSEFKGFIDYSPGSITAGTTNITGGNVTFSIPYIIRQPLFETRNLQTSVVIWDGQTVVLGGLMREEIQKINDKVPFFGDIPVVGRLFRSKVNNRTKRNLLVFVTARLIDPAGNPIHRSEAAAMR